MELNHLEDFMSLCGTRSFSRSAAARNITQSAFSRRIQALEVWLGTPLLDRSTFPTTLTAEGRLFRETAAEVLGLLEEARSNVHARRGRSQRMVSFAALHTLALSTLPKWLKDIERKLGAINTEVLADNSHNCIQALVEGKSDFLLTFHHDAVPSSIDPERYPFIVLGQDRLLAASVASDGVPAFRLEDDTPLLAYGQDSFLGRLSTHALRRSGVNLIVSHVNDNAIAEVIKAMVLAGHGVAWLPESLISRELASGMLHDLGAAVPMEIRLYRSAEKMRKVVATVWNAAGGPA